MFDNTPHPKNKYASLYVVLNTNSVHIMCSVLVLLEINAFKIASMDVFTSDRYKK
jgi:hypothetical protein